MQKYDYTHLNLSITELDYKNDKIRIIIPKIFRNDRIL